MENDKDYSGKKSVAEAAQKVYDAVVDAFAGRRDRDNDISRFREVYNCKLGDQQEYDGDSTVFVPVVRDAVEARVLRFSNTLFPSNGRFVDCISTTSDTPRASEALINNYIRKIGLRETCGALFREGDQTGQCSVYVGWCTEKRKMKQRIQKAVTVEGFDTGEMVDDIEEIESKSHVPDVWVIQDEDLVVMPSTVDRIDDAETVAIAMRVTKGWLYEHEDDFSPSSFKKALSLFDADLKQINRSADPEKERSKEAGVRVEQGVKRLLLYQIWTKLKLDDERQPAMILAYGPNQFLHIKKNPYWGKRVPIISAPIKKVAGSFFGVSPIKAVEKLQYQCNDAVNIGMDSAKYALMPIVMTDPLKNPRVGSMVLAMAAVWETNPNDTQLVQFPKLWQDALGIVAALKAQIHESFGLNPALMPQGGAPSRKPTQAQVALEQQVALESVADAVKVVEATILTPLVERIFEYDQQFRDEEVQIAMYGELGYEAAMEKIPVIQYGSRYQFVWAGVERMQSAQRVQQMIAAMNVLRGIPPQQLNGRQLDIGPILDHLADVTFGPRVAPRVLKDVRSQMSVDPQLENEMLGENMPVPVHPLDDDQKHMMAHHAFAMQHGDPHQMISMHMMEHQKQLAQKQAAMAPQGGAPGVPGGAGPGVPGTPQPGAVPAGPRQMKGPPGMIHPDQMRDPGMMPRKT